MAGAINALQVQVSPVTLTATNTSQPDLGGAMNMISSISFFGPTSAMGDGTYGLPLMLGVTRSYADGNPTSPCLELTQPGFWRFKWTVGPGGRSIYCNAKQISNTGSRPTMVVKANPDIGVANDLSSSAPSSADWVVMPTISFFATVSGSVVVELHNNANTITQTSALFDHLVVN